VLDSLVLPNFSEATLVEISNSPPPTSGLKSSADFVKFWQERVRVSIFLNWLGNPQCFASVRVWPESAGDSALRDSVLLSPSRRTVHVPNVLRYSHDSQCHSRDGRGEGHAADHGELVC